MKTRYLAAIMIFLMTILALSGCTKTAQSISISNLFSASCHYQSENFEATMDLKRQPDGGWEINFSSPETIAGLQLYHTKDEILLNFQELESNIIREKLPTTPIYEEITQAIDEFILSGEIIFTKNSEEEILAEITTENGDFSFVFDEKSQKLIRIEGELGLVCSFIVN